jgi:O-antigen/teichoic acid export membrane protein
MNNSSLNNTTESTDDNISADFSNGRKRIGARAFIGTFGTSVFVQGCTVIQGIILARLLGPAGRGDFAAVILWPTIFANIGLLGTSFAIGRLSAKVSDTGTVLRSGLILAGLSSLLTVFIGYLLLPFLVPSEKYYILPLIKLFLLYIPVYQLACNLAAVDQGSGNFLRLNFIRGLQSPALITCLIVIYLLGLEELKWFVLAWLVSFTCVTISRLALLLWEYRIKGQIYSLIKILRDGFSFGLVAIGVQFYQYGDRILLLWLLEPRYMGLYVVALSASSVINIIGSSMGLVSFTITAQESDAEGFSRVGSIFRKALITKFVFGGILAGAMPFLLPLVYSSRFDEAVVPAVILIFGTAFAGLSMLLDQCMRGQGKPFSGLIGRIAAIIIMVAIGFPATKIYGLGAIGMAGAFLAAQFMYLCVIIFQVLRHYDNAAFSGFIPKKDDILAIVKIFKKYFSSVLPG